MSQWTHDESSLCTLSKTTHCVSRGANDWPTNQNEEPVDQWATGLGPSYHLSPAANHLVKPISIKQKCPRWKKARWETFNKAGCVISMVIVSILPHAELGPNDHQDDAPHCTENNWKYRKSVYSRISLSFKILTKFCLDSCVKCLLVDGDQITNYLLY